MDSLNYDNQADIIEASRYRDEGMVNQIYPPELQLNKANTMVVKPRRASHGVNISQLIRFARVCNHVADFNARNKCLTAKLLQQGYRYHKLPNTFLSQTL